MMNKRVVVLVIDSFGIGEAPDAGDFGDRGLTPPFISAKPCLRVIGPT
jgi:phosphopentomutase